MGGGQGHFERAHFNCHESFAAFADPDKQAFPWPQFGDAVAAQGLHMDEYIRRAFALGQKAKSTNTVEPFHDGDLKATGGHRFDGETWPPPFARMHRLRTIYGENLENLEALGPANGFTDDPGSFKSRLETILAQSRNMQKNVGFPIIWYEEAITLGRIKPFHPPGKLNQILRVKPRQIRDLIDVESR